MTVKRICAITCQHVLQQCRPFLRMRIIAMGEDTSIHVGDYSDVHGNFVLVRDNDNDTA